MISSRHFFFFFFFSKGPDYLQKKNFLEEKDILPRGWKVSFKIIPTDIVKDWSSILHATQGGDFENDGDCTPAVWFKPNSLKPFICSSVNGDKYYCYTFPDLPFYKVATIRIQQIQSTSNHRYYYEIYINKNKVQRQINKEPHSFKNVKYYASDPFYEPAKAKFDDFELTTFKHVDYE